MSNVRMYAFFSLFLATTPATAGEIEMTELGESAQTLSAGELLLHPLFYASSYGITDDLQVNLSILEYLGQPNVALEYNLTDNETLAISVNTFFSTDWATEYNTVGSGGTLTIKLDEDNLNFSAGKERIHQRTDFDVEPYGSPVIPLAISYDHRLDEATVLHFGVKSDGFQIANKRAPMILSAHWAHSINNVRLRLGVDAVAGVHPLSTLSPVMAATAAETGAAGALPDWPVVPLPHLEMWFSF